MGGLDGEIMAKGRSIGSLLESPGSPCIGCPHEFEDKNGRSCLKCEARAEYIDRSELEIHGDRQPFQDFWTIDIVLRPGKRFAVCRSCGNRLSVDKFWHDANNSSRNYTRHSCIECERRRRREARSKTKDGGIGDERKTAKR